MIGGGRGAFIGAVHRMAAALDGQIELVCGAFSSDPERSKLSGGDLFLPAERCYGTYEEMIRTEATLPEHVRMDVVSIVTPNHMHFGPAMMALEHGFHVIGLSESAGSTNTPGKSTIIRAFVCADTYLHWLSDDQASQADDCKWRARDDKKSGGRISARMAEH